jgi:hypothetical protein
MNTVLQGAIARLDRLLEEVSELEALASWGLPTR